MRTVAGDARRAGHAGRQTYLKLSAGYVCHKRGKARSASALATNWPPAAVPGPLKAMKSTILVSQLALLLITSIAASAATEERLNRRFSVQPGGTVVVEVDFGAINVSTNATSEVVVDVWRKIGRKKESRRGGVPAGPPRHVHSGWQHRDHPVPRQSPLVLVITRAQFQRGQIHHYRPGEVRRPAQDGRRPD